MSSHVRVLFSYYDKKKKQPLCGLLKHVSRPLEQKTVLLDSQNVHFCFTP